MGTKLPRKFRKFAYAPYKNHSQFCKMYIIVAYKLI